MNKTRNIILSVMAAVATLVAAVAATGCTDGNAEPKVYAVTYSAGDGSGTPPVGASYREGEKFDLPQPTGLMLDEHTFDGWSDGTNTYSAGDEYTMPSCDVAFTAQWKADVIHDPDDPDDPDGSLGVTYVFNLVGVPHSGSLTAQKGETGDGFTVKDGNDFGVGDEYKFLGWTTNRSGPVYFTDGAHDGQYFAGDDIVLGDKNITLYAQWAKRYTDVREISDDKIYIYDALIGRGLGAAILVRDGEDDKLGFTAQADDGYYEVQFMFDAADGGDVFAKLVDDDKYLYSDGTTGSYLMYDHAERRYVEYILRTDGYGNATIIRMVGDQLSVYAYGYYEYDREYDDYVFVYVDPTTGDPMTDEYGEPLVLYFAAVRHTIENTEFDGYFIQQGGESGSYLLYANGDLEYYYRLDLNGYGGAKLYEMNVDTELFEEIAEGTYYGTDDYGDYRGEWHFDPITVGMSDFDFVLNMINDASGSIPVYIEHDPTLEKEFIDPDNAQSTLYLSGYGTAIFTLNGQTLEGYCSVNDGRSLVTFIPIIESGDAVTAGGKMYFDVDFEAGTFAVNADGYVVDNGTLVEYRGESTVIVIPNGVTAIAADVFKYDVESGFSVTHVTIPASVTEIGTRAFENNYTLHRVTFLSDTPVDLSWLTTANNPFRWAAGDFVIVVPENSVDAYKAAWSAKFAELNLNYAIKGDEEVTRLDEFEIENGVLVRYNKQEGSGDALEITIPDGVTEIANNVFRGLDFIKSVDLNGVVAIGDGAFEYCVNLQTVKLDNVQTIGISAFLGCESLEGSGETVGTLELPAITVIADNAFQGCEKLRLVRLGASIEDIGTMAFMECNIYEADPPIFLELTGTELPAMAEKIFYGCIAFRIKVPDFVTAKKFYDSPAYASYCSSLYIESGEEKGKYIDGSNILELDGRAILSGSLVMIYKIEDTTITLLAYDKETTSYATIVGTIRNDTITFEIGSTRYSFTKIVGNTVRFTSVDGAYTLECDPAVLDPEYYESYSGTSTVLFNGVQASLFINGYNTKIIRGYADTDGILYDITIALESGNKFTYTKARSAYYLRNITSADGSNITLHFTATAIYVFGEIKEVLGVGDDGKDVLALPATSIDYMYSVTQVSDNVFTFVRQYKNDRYTVTLTLSQDKTTFTYSCEKI